MCKSSLPHLKAVYITINFSIPCTRVDCLSLPPRPDSSKSFRENITLAISLDCISKKHKFPQPSLCSSNYVSEMKTGFRSNCVLGKLCFAPVLNFSLHVAHARCGVYFVSFLR